MAAWWFRSFYTFLANTKGFDQLTLLTFPTNPSFSSKSAEHGSDVISGRSTKSSANSIWMCGNDAEWVQCFVGTSAFLFELSEGTERGRFTSSHTTNHPTVHSITFICTDQHYDTHSIAYTVHKSAYSYTWIKLPPIQHLSNGLASALSDLLFCLVSIAFLANARCRGWITE